MPGLDAAKAYAALVGSIATGLLAVFTGDTVVGQVLTVVAVVATAIVTYRVPNAGFVREREVGKHERTD